MATSSNKLDDDSALSEDLFNLASNVDLYNFVSVKLSGNVNYLIWMDQMLCFIESQELLHIIDPKKHSFPKDKGIHKKTQYDKLVKGWIFGSLSKNVFKKFSHVGSATRLWAELESSFKEPKIYKEQIGIMYGKDLSTDAPDIENTSSIIRNRLYDAAVKGNWWKAKSLLEAHKIAPTEPIIKNHNTILHVAVEMGQNYFIEKLLEFLEDKKDMETKNLIGQTALHIAVMVSNEYAIRLLVRKRKELLMISDCDDISPLKIAHTSGKLNICVSLLRSLLSCSGLTSLHLWDIISIAIEVKQYDVALQFLKRDGNDPNVYTRMLSELAPTFPNDIGYMESFIHPSFHNVRHKAVEKFSLLFDLVSMDKYVYDILRIGKIYNNTSYRWLGKFLQILLVPMAILYPVYQLMCLLILGLHLTFSMLYFFLWKVLAVTVCPIKNIEKKKTEYKQAKELLRFLCEWVDSSNPAHHKRISVAAFEAVLIGAYKVLDEILFMSPNVMGITDDEGHNIIQVAIINRSEKVYNLIRHIIVRTESYRIVSDYREDNLVHLVGRLAPSFVLGRTTGAALQLQRELLWREEIAKLEPGLCGGRNIDNDTPTMLFTKEHQDLMKEGETWMKTTAESCSITAALIVTVVFAAAITVPGGSNQESGIPLFKKKIAFTIFALSDALSLFTSTTSLLLFLSILTARFSEKDFLVSLPRRLIFGLLTLFLSTTAMIVAFGATAFIVFCDQRPWMLAPIVLFACLPISVIVTIKLPLLIDLVRSTYFPIFGKQSYLQSCRTNEENTVFHYNGNH